MMEMFEVEMDSAPMTNRDTDTILGMGTASVGHNDHHHHKYQIRDILLLVWWLLVLTGSSYCSFVGFTYFPDAMIAEMGECARYNPQFFLCSLTLTILGTTIYSMVLHFTDLYNKCKARHSSQQNYGQSHTATTITTADEVNVVNNSNNNGNSNNNNNSCYVDPRLAIKQHSFLVLMMTTFAVVDIIVAILILANADLTDCPRDVVYSCLFAGIATFVVVIVTFWSIVVWFYRVTGHNPASEPVAV